MNVAQQKSSSPEYQEVCSIVILYDHEPNRTRAMAACDFLVNQFWEYVEMEFHWWRTDFLRDAKLGRAAAENAVGADFLIICCDGELGSLPEIEAWFETWLDRRTGPQGALLDLQATTKTVAINDEPESFVAEVARRGRFDYLTSMPGMQVDGEDDFPEEEAIVPVKDNVTIHSRPPTHYGLNE